MLDLNLIALFVEAVRANSFAEAARRLGLPSNAVSRAVQQLETTLDTRLIHRSTRKLSLTPAGSIFFERCQEPVAALAGVGRETLDRAALPNGLLRVAAPNSFFDVFEMEWLIEFLERFPQIKMEVFLSDAKTDLIDERIDVAFRAGHMLELANVGQKLVSTVFGLVASPTYILKRGLPGSLEELNKHNCLPQSNRSGSVVWQLEGPGGSQHIRVTGSFVANTSQVVKQAAVGGLGIALLPEPVTAADVAAGKLVKVLSEYRRLGADLYAVYPARQHILSAASAFVEFAISKVRIS